MKNVIRIMGTVAILAFLAVDGHAATRIKIATLAPEGTSWMNVMNAMAKEIQQKTGGEVTFKFYSGGVMGDEKNVIRKMKFGQVSGGAFTGRGLGEINPEERVLELPNFFKDDKEVDCVIDKLTPKLASGYEKKGYVFLGWIDVGFAYIFTNRPINARADLKGVKMWMWEGDPLAKEMFKVHGLTPVPLDLPNVMTSLQTGLIDAVYNAPYGAVALQWHTRLKYMTDMRLAYGSGAVLINKSEFDKLTPDQQKIVKEVAKKHCRDLTVKTRTENQNAIATIKKAGIKLVKVSDEAKIIEISRQVYYGLVGTLYSKSFVDEAIGIRDACRAGK